MSASLSRLSAFKGNGNKRLRFQIIHSIQRWKSQPSVVMFGVWNYIHLLPVIETDVLWWALLYIAPSFTDRTGRNSVWPYVTVHDIVQVCWNNSVIIYSFHIGYGFIGLHTCLQIYNITTWWGQIALSDSQNGECDVPLKLLHIRSEI